MNVNFKIEAKKLLSPTILKSYLPEQKLSDILKTHYKVFSKDIFMLPYKVQKLSKKARRN